MTERVSIVITTYNRADLILGAVNSCLQQTYTNVEIIVVDDGSADDTESALKELIAENKIKYHYKKNEERAVARNTGMQLSTGSYIKFLDSDDYIEKDYVESCIRYFEANKRCELVHTNCKILNEDNTISLPPKKGVTGNVYEMLWESNDISFSSVMIRRSVFEKYGGFDETWSLSGAEDWEYWVRLSKYGCIVGFVPAFITIIRLHQDNSTMNDIEKIVFSSNEAQRLLEQKFDIEQSLTDRFAARLIYLQAVYFYINRNHINSLRYLTKSALKDQHLLFKNDFWSLLLKNFLPQKLIHFIKQKKG